MKQTSTFRGFKGTKDAADAFIMEKAALYLYLAHTKFNSDTMGSPDSKSLLNLVYDKVKYAKKDVITLEKNTEFPDYNV